MGRDMTGNERRELRKSKDTEGFEGQNKKFVLDVGVQQQLGRDVKNTN